jgi:uncharacterized phage protein gp47/JayE
MALQEPTTKEIFDQIIANIEARLGQTIPILPKATFRVLSLALAAVFMILYKFGSWQFLQIFPSLADEDSLQEWGEIVGIFRNPAEAARLEIEVSGTDGQVVRTGTRLINNLQNTVYIVESDVTISGGVGTTIMISVTAGAIGNLDNGSQVSFETPLPGVDKKATVTDTVEQGVDQESLEFYRERVVNRFRQTPQGGALADYRAWALEVTTIINAYPYSGDIEGTVLVFTESSVSPDGIPNPTELQEVLDSINQPDRRPVTAEVFSLPIVRTPFDVTVLGLSPDTPESRDIIETLLAQYFLEREPFIEGLDNIDKSLISQTEIIQIISLALQTTNASFDTAIFEVSGTGDTLTRYNLGQGEKSKINIVSYI